MAKARIAVRCKVSEGLFETEFFVVLRDSSAYVARNNVKVSRIPVGEQEVEGEVLAYLIELDDTKDRALVQLSGEPAVGGLQTWVPKSSLAPGIVW
jgi:hypothetical protein